MINPYIFREYDIRGEVKADFTEEVVINLGRAFGTYVKRNGSQEISLSGDVRLTTPELLQSFKQGVLSTGIDVINLGILPTPVNYYSMFHLGISGAAQITGSHNPPEFNGFKLSYDKKAVYGKAIQKLYELIDKNDFEQGKGTETRYNILPSYKKMILSKITLDRHMKVVLDCGNAAGCINAPDIFKSLDLDLLELFCEKDGTFPNHHPDPSVKSNLNELTKKMKTGKYDIGIAFDGDADRIGVIDEKGDMLWADQIIALFLPEIIKNGETILFDVKCSQALEDMIKKYGGNPVMWKTGHSLIKEKMIELGCKLGGEMSGHIFFADDYFGYDDAIYVAARLIQMLSKTKKTLSDLKSELPVYHSTPELRLEIENDKEKFRMADQAISYFKKNYNCITVDGVRIKFSDGWALVRQSNTQPVIVCRFEAKTAERMDEIKNLVMDKLREFGSFSLGGH
tara:strand:- start:621 stop:1985 length:1365 start_codon:yes stop_codon:yes gene_type:complete